MGGLSPIFCARWKRFMRGIPMQGCQIVSALSIYVSLTDCTEKEETYPVLRADIEVSQHFLAQAQTRLVYPWSLAQPLDALPVFLDLRITDLCCPDLDVGPVRNCCDLLLYRLGLLDLDCIDLGFRGRSLLCDGRGDDGILG